MVSKMLDFLTQVFVCHAKMWYIMQGICCLVTLFEMPRSCMFIEKVIVQLIGGIESHLPGGYAMMLCIGCIWVFLKHIDRKFRHNVDEDS